MWSSSIPAFVPFFLAAGLAAVTRGRTRSTLMLLIVALSGLHLWFLEGDVLVRMAFLDYELMPYRVDGLSVVFGYVFHIAAFISILFSLHVKDTTQHVAGLLYAGSALGALFAGVYAASLTALIERWDFIIQFFNQIFQLFT